jgi:hypothetical protein
MGATLNISKKGFFIHKSKIFIALPKFYAAHQNRQNHWSLIYIINYGTSTSNKELHIDGQLVIYLQDTRKKFNETDVIGSGFNQVSKSGSEFRIWIQEEKLTHETEKSLEISCFKVPDDLLRGMKASPVAYTSFMEAW